jgi:addiction module HigA family antidote
LDERRRVGLVTGTEEGVNMKKEDIDKLPPIHPSEILRTEFLEPMSISQNRLAQAINISPGQISEIVKGKRRITVSTAILLGDALKTGPEFWLRIQSRYEDDNDK